MISSMWNLTRAPTYRSGLVDKYLAPGNVSAAQYFPQICLRLKEKIESKPDNEFKVMLNVTNFKSDEIDVKIVDGFVVVHAKHEENFDGHGFVAREFTRRIKIPANVEHDKLVTNLSSNDILTIKAPRKQSSLLKSVKIIPITVHPSVLAEATKIF